MNRRSRYDRGRESSQGAAHRIASFAFAMLLVALLASAAVIARSPSTARAQVATPITATVTPDTAVMYVAIDLDTTSAQYQKATELLQRMGVDSSIEDLAGQATSGMSGGNTVDATQMQALLGGEAGIALFNFSAMS